MRVRVIVNISKFFIYPACLVGGHGRQSSALVQLPAETRYESVSRTDFFVVAFVARLHAKTDIAYAEVWTKARCEAVQRIGRTSVRCDAASEPAGRKVERCVVEDICQTVIRTAWVQR